ncbi:MAG: PSD1 and planctomycete cytochrome C domain-containing protein [Fuerstiella sp.]
MLRILGSQNPFGLPCDRRDVIRIGARQLNTNCRRNCLVGCLCFLLAGTPSMMVAAEPEHEAVNFARDVRRIFSDRCFRCHGPDRISRKADLRLDKSESLFADRNEQQIVVPGKPNSSELIRRVTSVDVDVVMPPPDSGLSLNQTEIALLRQWVSQGAKWDNHWAYIAPKRPPTPDVRLREWPDNEIDSFVLAGLEQKGMIPSPEADRRTLIRRASLDLTGLPPTPDEVADFLNDTATGAWGRLVDRLLSSVRYGERMTLPWLEASRYADTSGYQEDYGRYMYPWRKWVIDAFNKNMPFDQFVIQQLAGDLLPDASQEQILATAFNRNHRINQEVGAIPEEYLVEYAVDRLETIGTMFLGSTIGCARCHDHKYEPISQKEFYQLFAFLNNNDDAGVDQQSRFGFCKPFIEYPTPADREFLAPLNARLDALKNEQSPPPEESKSFRGWLDKMETKLPLGIPVWRSLGPFEHAELSVSSGYHEVFLPTQQVDPDATVDGQKWTTKPAWTDGNVLFIGGEFTTHYLYRELLSPMDMDLLVDVAASDAIKFWVNGQLVHFRETPGKANPDPEQIRIRLRQGSNTLLVKLSNGDFIQAFSFAQQQRESVPPKMLAMLMQAPAERGVEEGAAIYDYFHGLRIADVEQQIKAVHDTFPKVMVMKERKDVRPAHILERGDYNQKREQVQRDTPAVLPPFPSNQPRNRLGLARWLMSPENPLPARVTVNRFWQMYFGTGLVKTAEDFGSQGEWPSHPDLLDWLAAEFIQSGWDVKHIQRLIVMSATYRQSSQMTAGQQHLDPENRLLARGPRLRLRPQFIRDQALFTSGLLVERIGGPSVKPYQPAGLWSEVSNLLLQKKWYNTNMFEQDTGEKLYRRSLYTFWKRTISPPNMTVFDAGNREVCSVRNQITNTPLQAMTLLNDVTYVEAARHLAHRMLSEGGESMNACLSHGMELVTCRQPTEVEQQILRQSLERHLSVYRLDPAAAARLLAHGDSALCSDYEPVEHAAWTQVALMLLNLDETITKQ